MFLSLCACSCRFWSLLWVWCSCAQIQTKWIIYVYNYAFYSRAWRLSLSSVDIFKLLVWFHCLSGFSIYLIRILVMNNKYVGVNVLQIPWMQNQILIFLALHFIVWQCACLFPLPPPVFIQITEWKHATCLTSLTLIFLFICLSFSLSRLADIHDSTGLRKRSAPPTAVAETVKKRQTSAETSKAYREASAGPKNVQGLQGIWKSAGQSVCGDDIWRKKGTVSSKDQTESSEIPGKKKGARGTTFCSMQDKNKIRKRNTTCEMEAAKKQAARKWNGSPEDKEKWTEEESICRKKANGKPKEPPVVQSEKTSTDQLDMQPRLLQQRQHTRKRQAWWRPSTEPQSRCHKKGVNMRMWSRVWWKNPHPRQRKLCKKDW